MIRDMKEKGTNNREIAWDLGMSRNTVSKLLRTTRLTDHRQRKRGSKLDPYRDRIRALIDEHNLSAVRILEEIRKMGYHGGYTILKEYCHGTPRIFPEEDPENTGNIQIMVLFADVILTDP